MLFFLWLHSQAGDFAQWGQWLEEHVQAQIGGPDVRLLVFGKMCHPRRHKQMAQLPPSLYVAFIEWVDGVHFLF